MHVCIPAGVQLCGFAVVQPCRCALTTVKSCRCAVVRKPNYAAVHLCTESCLIRMMPRRHSHAPALSKGLSLLVALGQDISAMQRRHRAMRPATGSRRETSRLATKNQNRTPAHDFHSMTPSPSPEGQGQFLSPSADQLFCEFFRALRSRCAVSWDDPGF